jgi:hypothetical protein
LKINWVSHGGVVEVATRNEQNEAENEVRYLLRCDDR